MLAHVHAAARSGRGSVVERPLMMRWRQTKAVMCTTLHTLLSH